MKYAITLLLCLATLIHASEKKVFDRIQANSSVRVAKIIGCSLATLPLGYFVFCKLNAYKDLFKNYRRMEFLRTTNQVVELGIPTFMAAYGLTYCISTISAEIDALRTANKSEQEDL